MHILVTWASRNGSTDGVAETIAEELRSLGHEVDLVRLGETQPDLAEYAAVVLGAPLYNLRWLAPARRFLKRNRKALAEKPVAVFALGPRADLPEAWERSREQLDKTLARFEWLTPAAVEVFGGADPQGKGTGRDIRDWAVIRAWAAGLPDAFASESPATGAEV